MYIYISYYYEGENVRNTVKQPRLSNGHLFILFEFRTHKGTRGIYGRSEQAWNFQGCNRTRTQHWRLHVMLLAWRMYEPLHPTDHLQHIRPHVAKRHVVFPSGGVASPPGFPRWPPEGEGSTNKKGKNHQVNKLETRPH
jgi:hypothetical protein